MYELFLACAIMLDGQSLFEVLPGPNGINFIYNLPCGAFVTKCCSNTCEYSTTSTYIQNKRTNTKLYISEEHRHNYTHGEECLYVPIVMSGDLSDSAVEHPLQRLFTKALQTLLAIPAPSERRYRNTRKRNRMISCTCVASLSYFRPEHRS